VPLATLKLLLKPGLTTRTLPRNTPRRRPVCVTVSSRSIAAARPTKSRQRILWRNLNVDNSSTYNRRHRQYRH